MAGVNGGFSLSEITARSKLNQNVVIDGRGLRVGRKVLISRESLPGPLQNSVPLCVALRADKLPNLRTIVETMAGDPELLSGQAIQRTISGISVTSDFTRMLLIAPDAQRVRRFVPPPLGIERIAAFLRTANDSVDVETYDPNLEGSTKLVNKTTNRLLEGETNNPQDPRLGGNVLIRKLASENYDVVGFGTLTPTLPVDINTIVNAGAMYRSQAGKAKPIFVMGNSGVLIGADKLFGAIDSLDMIVWGPGEYPLLKMVRAIQNKKRELVEQQRRSGGIGQVWMRGFQTAILNSVLSSYMFPAVAATRNSGAQPHPEFRMPSVTLEQLIELETGVDHFFIPYEDHWKTYGKTANDWWINFHCSTTSCPMGCLFCATPKDKIQLLPADIVINIWLAAVKAYPEITSYAFTDDNLLINKPHAQQLMRGLLEARNRHPMLERGLHFYGECRPNSLTDADGPLMDNMQRLGFEYLAIGGETFSHKTIVEIRKGTKPGDIEHTVNLAGAHNIKTIVNLILGFPNMTLEDAAINIGESLRISMDPRVELDHNWRLYAYNGAPLTIGIEHPGRLKDPALDADWVRRTGINYVEAAGIRIPHSFTIIDPSIESLMTDAKDLAERACSAVSVDRDDTAIKGLIALWAIFTLVNDSRRGLSNVPQKFTEFPGLFETVLRSRYGDAKEYGIILALQSVELQGNEHK